MATKKSKPAAGNTEKDLLECIENVLLNWQRENQEIKTKVVQLRGLAAFENEFLSGGTVPWWSLLRQVVEGLAQIQASLEYGRGILQKGFDAFQGIEKPDVPF